MSKQTSEFPDLPEVPRHTSGGPKKKNAKGPWEIWQRFHINYAALRWRNWQKCRSYKTKEQAINVLKKLRREIFLRSVEYQLRYNGEIIDIDREVE